MNEVLLYLQAFFEQPEAVVCCVYFLIRFVYWLATRKRSKNQTVTQESTKAEVDDIFVATAQIYELIKAQKEQSKNETPENK